MAMSMIRLYPGPALLRSSGIVLLTIGLAFPARGQESAILAPVATETSTTESKTNVETPVAKTVETDAEPTVRFSFSGVPWRDVIEWIAEEANLALHIDAVPSGSFTYSDPSSFTHEGAIDRINLFLLPQGFTLVRSGNLLSVIDVSDPRSMQQLDAIAQLIRVEDLTQWNEHSVVKCLFPLGALDANEALEELSSIKLMVTPSVLSKTKQLLITDTVSKLKDVKAILDSFEPSALDNGTVVKSFPLKHVSAEDILIVARPHLGLATGEMIGIDVSLSSDLEGKYLFATGIEDKIKLIERLVEAIDTPTESMTDINRGAKFQAHKVVGGNVDLAYDVLVTLLAGNDIRLSKDETAGTVVAFAPPELQQQIAETVEKLSADVAQFEVIPLRTVDPYVAIGLIEQMLDLSTGFDEDEQTDVDPPKIDADPDNRRLFVRGKRDQIDQIKQIVEGLDGKRTENRSDDRIRLLPLTGSEAETAVKLVSRFWREPNPIMLFESESGRRSKQTERVLHGGDLTSSGSNGGAAEDSVELIEAIQKNNGSRFVSVDDRGKLLETQAMDLTKPTVECQLTSRGLLLQCDDPQVLDRFQSHLELLAASGSDLPSEPIVYYLKYTKPEQALRMLAELLDGGDAVDPTSDSLVNASITSPSDSLFGSLITNREGTLSLIAGSITVVADPRLNRLIAQGTTEDIERIENYLKIIEKDSSLTSIETFGVSHVIELKHTRAVDVEAAIRSAFAGRVAESNANRAPQGGSGQSQRPDPKSANEQAQAKDNKKENAKQSKAPSKPSVSAQPQMTLAVHEPSNSLIVTAPDHLVKQVEQLAKTIDQRGEQTIQIVTPSNSEVMETVLQQLLLGQSEGPRSSPRPTRDRSDR